MNAFCTYCSASKSQESGSIPAIRRYQSSRIERVYTAADQLEIEFYILSGKFGLIFPNQPIPFYDHLLNREEVSALAELIAKQIREYRITRLVYFTKPLASNKNLVPYHDSLSIACKQVSLPFFVVELEDVAMNTWRTVMEAADSAKFTMISDRTAGEKQFESLLEQHPRDGMIYFKRGEAYEAIGEAKLATADFQRAIAMFPKPEWKTRAKEALDRVKE
jgi:hypothetical protein